MADSAQSQTSGKGALTIPADVAAKFSELVGLIQKSESMNDEERQYWINILPIMTPEQIKSLRDILDNEKKQLQAIDEKYSKEMQKIGQNEQIQKTATDRKAKRENRQSEEASHKAEEDQRAEEILQAIESESSNPPAKPQ